MSESHSRATIQCDHCGLEITRHNLKVHTKRHHPGLVVKERIKRQIPVSGFFTSKKAKIDDILPDKAKAISAELVELNFGQIQWYLGQIQFFFWENTVVFWANTVVFGVNTGVFWANTRVFWAIGFLGKHSGILGK